MNPAVLAMMGCRVESGAWSPASLPGVDLWLRGDSLSGLTPGDSLTTWSDESGAGNHATASTANPTYATSWGFPAAAFSAQKMYSPVSVGGATQTAFVVLSTRTAVGLRTAVGGNGWNHFALQATATNNLPQAGLQQQFGANLAAYSNQPANKFESAGWNVLMGTWDDANDTIRVGLDYLPWATLTGATRTGTPSVTMQIGAQNATSANWFSGQIAEVIHCSVVLGAVDIATTIDYLAAKYSIT